ncbi:MAG: glycosyltransferase family 2 protein [Planctomycetota bacterium]|nr:glycosyltransferase family 2 protein [Planctomycetota bacterium]
MTLFFVLSCSLVLCVFILGYVYLIFPLVMACIAQWVTSGEQGCTASEQDEHSNNLDLPGVTLIIPAYNEASVIEQKLLNALALDYPGDRLEIIVGCDGGSDRTVSIAKSVANPRIRILDFPERRGKAAVINDAVSQSKGDVLLLCDANVMFSADALRRLVATLKRDGVGAVSGDVQLDSAGSSFGAGESAYYRLERMIHRGESAIASMMGVDGGMYVLHKKLFHPIPADTILDDFTISMGVIRSGHRILYEPRAVATENATEYAKTEYQRRVRLSSGSAQVVLRGFFPSLSNPIDFWLFGSHKFLRWVSPFLIVIMVISACLLMLQDDEFGFVVFGRLVIIAVLMLTGIASAVAMSRRLRKTPCVAIPFYFLMSQVAIGQGILKGIRGHWNPRWERTTRASNAPQQR